MNTNLKEEWILANANLLAEVVLTEVEHYQRTKQKKIKSITLNIASAAIPKCNAILCFKPTHETRYVEYLVSYGISNPLKDGEEMRIHFYEEGMSKKSSKEEVTITIAKNTESYKDIIVAFLKNAMVY